MPEKLAIGVAIAIIAATAGASEIVNYTYDAQGQLVKVVRKGTVNDNVVTTYGYDNAFNIANKTTAGAPQ